MVFFLAIVVTVVCSFDCGDNGSSDYAALEHRIEALENNEPAGKNEVDALAEATMLAISHNHYRIDTLSQKSRNRDKLIQSELAVLSNVHESDHNALLDSVALLQRLGAGTEGYIWITATDSLDAPRLYTYKILDGPPESPLRDIEIEWDPNRESDLAGYRIYVESTEGTLFITSTGPATEFKIDDLKKDIEYRIKMTAYDHNFNESGFSEELIIPKEL